MKLLSLKINPNTDIFKECFTKFSEKASYKSTNECLLIIVSDSVMMYGFDNVKERKNSSVIMYFEIVL